MITFWVALSVAVPLSIMLNVAVFLLADRWLRGGK